MGRVWLSKSKYCKCVQCEKIIWLNHYKPECAVKTTKESILKNGTKVGELAKGLFGKYEDINPKYLEQINFEIENLKPKIDREAIKNFVSTIKYPLYSKKEISIAKRCRVQHL